MVCYHSTVGGSIPGAVQVEPGECVTYAAQLCMDSFRHGEEAMCETIWKREVKRPKINEEARQHAES
jgi:hypothetical protein